MNVAESVAVHRRRRRDPRPLDRVPPGEGARVARRRLGRRRPRSRQGSPWRRCFGNRLRRRSQQLLPARDERADAGVCRGVGVRPGGIRIQPGRLYRARGGGARGRPVGNICPAGADRVPLGADPGRGRGRRAHERALPRLARAGRDDVPARAPGRLRLQHGLGRGGSRASAARSG